MMNELRYWVQIDDSALHVPRYSGTPRTNSMGVPMMVICCLNELFSLDSKLEEEYEELMEDCVQQLLMHVQVHKFNTRFLSLYRLPPSKHKGKTRTQSLTPQGDFYLIMWFVDFPGKFCSKVEQR